MGVGGIRGGGGRGRAGGPKGAGGAGGAGKAGGVGKASGAGSAGRADKAEGLVGPSGLAGSANVGATDPMTSLVVKEAAQLKAALAKASGEEAKKLREEATRKVIEGILAKKLRVKSQALAKAIHEQLKNDPNMSQKIDQMWSKA